MGLFRRESGIPDREVLEFLESLGTYSEDVASTLHDLGVVGERCSPESCPIARALVMKFGERVEVRNSKILIGDNLAVLAPFPSAVESFISYFDTGMHFTDLLA